MSKKNKKYKNERAEFFSEMIIAFFFLAIIFAFIGEWEAVGVVAIALVICFRFN